MKLQFFGAARQVTGSKHLVTTDGGTRVLLDCGLFQGIHTDELNQRFGFNPAGVDVLVLSHAHIDHSGLIPRLVAQGFRGPIYCTPATKDLCELLLGDSARIQETDLERVNRRRRKRGQEPLESLYSPEDVEAALRLFKPIPYHHETRIAPDVRVLFTDTGHILGSAAVSLTISEGRTEKRLFFSGDIGRPHDKILRMPEAFPQADFILCESTYGDQRHPPEDDVKAGLLNAFDFPNLHYISDVEDSKALNGQPWPAIIISASGMAEAGRIKHHIRNNIDDSRNTILLVGYASPNSLGGALKRGDREVTIFGDRYPVRARVAVMDSFSAHADYAEMMDYLACQDKSKVKTLFLVHGEYDEQQAFRQRLLADGWPRVEIPEQGQGFKL